MCISWDLSRYSHSWRCGVVKTNGGWTQSLNQLHFVQKARMLMNSSLISSLSVFQVLSWLGHFLLLVGKMQHNLEVGMFLQVVSIPHERLQKENCLKSSKNIAFKEQENQLWKGRGEGQDPWNMCLLGHVKTVGSQMPCGLFKISNWHLHNKQDSFKLSNMSTRKWEHTLQ